jgi:hypothetical protein
VSDPFLISEPTAIAFSGGRTSAYMLWRVLQSNGGLPPETVVLFNNTGKEDEATLRFVRDCGINWNVPIVWIEFRHAKTKFEIVNFETASRNGEPFEALIRWRGFLPNPVSRFCTMELKVRPAARYLLSIGMCENLNQGENMSMIGMRADEQRRAAKIADKSRIPLVAAGVTKEIVGEFWRNNSFDLELPNNNGVTMHGNCDLCFLKGGAQIQSLIAEKPSRAIWWAEMENLPREDNGTPWGGYFRKDRPSYAAMMQYAADQKTIFDPHDEAISCFCGD